MRGLAAGSIRITNAANMVSMPERFRGHTVDVVYVGSNPTTHPQKQWFDLTFSPFYTIYYKKEYEKGRRDFY